MKTKYSKIHKPPAPVGKIKIRNIDTSKVCEDIEMLLDTGADVTIIPTKFCEKIGVRETNESVEIEGFNTAKSVAHYVKLDFFFLHKMFRGNFLILDLEEGIIGRDILNEFSLELDGINQFWISK